MIICLDSVCFGRQEESFRIVRSFVRSVEFPVAVNQIMECTVLSQTQLLHRSHSQTIGEVGHQSTQHYNFMLC